MRARAHAHHTNRGRAKHRSTQRRQRRPRRIKPGGQRVRIRPRQAERSPRAVDSRLQIFARFGRPLGVARPKPVQRAEGPARRSCRLRRRRRRWRPPCGRSAWASGGGGTTWAGHQGNDSMRAHTTSPSRAPWMAGMGGASSQAGGWRGRGDGGAAACGVVGRRRRLRHRQQRPHPRQQGGRRPGPLDGGQLGGGRQAVERGVRLLLHGIARRHAKPAPRPSSWRWGAGGAGAARMPWGGGGIAPSGRSPNDSERRMADEESSYP